MIASPIFNRVGLNLNQWLLYSEDDVDNFFKITSERMYKSTADRDQYYIGTVMKTLCDKCEFNYVQIHRFYNGSNWSTVYCTPNLYHKNCPHTKWTEHPLKSQQKNKEEPKEESDE